MWVRLLFKAPFRGECEDMQDEIASLEGKRITVVGAGVSGAGLALLAHTLGAKVFVSDEKKMPGEDTANLFNERGIEWEEGGHTPRLFEADCILVGSGVSPKASAVTDAIARGIPVVGELDFVAPYLQGKIIGVTGSNGKSTTTALIGHLLSRAGFSVDVVGNIGRSIAGAALQKRDYIVAELSSFQLHWNTRFSCDLAIVTNLAPDHIDWHGSYGEYVKAKSNILLTLKPGGYALVQRSEHPLLFDRSPAGENVFSFSWSDGVRSSPRSFVADETSGQLVMHWPNDEKEVLFRFDEVPLMGRHNIENASFAAASVRLLSEKGVFNGRLFSGFKGLPHRCEYVATVQDVTYVDDSKGTNVAASATALESLAGPKVVILGGKGKGEDYAPLAEAVKREAIAAVVLGAERERIVEALVAAGFPDIIRVDSMDEAVRIASHKAPPHSVVLLSPACTSWDMYPNYERRGEHFKQLVMRLKSEAER